MSATRSPAVLLVLAVMVASAGYAAQQIASEAEPVYPYIDKAPGESQRVPPRVPGAPPVIPHLLDGLLPITRDSNACVLCHGTPGARTEVPPPAPSSHFVDWRHVPAESRTEIAGAR